MKQTQYSNPVRIKKDNTPVGKLRWNTKCKLGILPNLIGTTIFFVIPFLRVIYYSLIDNQFRRNFVGLGNYLDTLKNEYFQLALANSLQLIIICVPILVILAILISATLAYGIKIIKRTRVAFVLPMLLPTASVILVWQVLFQDVSTVIPIYLLFLWKNIGICIILITSAYTAINSEVFDAASIDGAKFLELHWYITTPIIAPTIFFALLLSIVNSFRIFKESYLYYGGNYPPKHSYTLQFYMSNNFLKLDYQALTTSAVITSFLILIIVISGLALQRRFDR